MIEREALEELKRICSVNYNRDPSDEEAVDVGIRIIRFLKATRALENAEMNDGQPTDRREYDTIGRMEDGKQPLPIELPPKPKAGLYIDDGNLYKRGKASGWMTDYKKLYKWVAQVNTIVHARIYKGRPKYEPAKTISEALEEYFTRIGYTVTAKDLKKLRDPSSPRGFRNKCNFDVEMHDEIMSDLADVDIVYLVSGDSDFLRTKDNVLKQQKHIKFLAYENNCAWEIRVGSWFVSLDSIRSEVERVPQGHQS